MNFSNKKERDSYYFEYAGKFYEIALDMVFYEDFTSNTILQARIIHKKTGNISQPIQYLNDTYEIFTSHDEFEKMKEV